MKITEKTSFCIHVTEKELELIYNVLAHAHCSVPNVIIDKKAQKELEPLIDKLQTTLFG